jgi:predicted amidophosphoribosyltransferase
MDNLKGAFAITRQGKKIISQLTPGAILIDDVLTTGSTVNECARTLRKAGIKRILVVTVMRG